MSLPTDYVYKFKNILWAYLFSGMKSHNCIYGYALFSFWKYIIIIIIFPVWCLSLAVYYTVIFNCKFPLDFFSTSIITPVYFFDILSLLTPLYPPSTIILSSTFIPFSTDSVKHWTCIYQLSSSQLYKMAIKNLQKKCFIKK